MASASGGLWKTENNGTTFESSFPGETTIISGEIDIAAGNPDIIWVGTDDLRIRHLGYAKKGQERRG